MANTEVPKASIPLQNGSSEPQTITILQADGLYPDDEYELQAFAPKADQNYVLNYIKGNLWEPGEALPKPWSSIPENIRNQIDGIMDLKLRFTADDLALFPNLKVFVRMGVGYDMVDRPACEKRGVVVCNVPDYGTSEIADHALALILSFRRGILLHHERQRASPPANWQFIDSPLVARLQGATFGILGLGRIGTAAALRAKAFGFNVLFYDPYVPNGTDKALLIERTRDIKELFRRSNVLSLHCNLTRETRGLVDYSLLKLLPQGAVLVNTSRGPVVSLDGVEKCLKEGNLAAAGLDVLPQEPIDEDNVHPLLQAYRRKEEWLEGRMAVTCHSAFYSPESFVDIRTKSVETLRDVLIEGVRSNVVTPEME